MPHWDWIRAVLDYKLSGPEEVVIVPIMPASWLFDYMHPEFLKIKDEIFKVELGKMKESVKWWPYIATESLGINNRFSTNDISSLSRCNRVLYYSDWGKQAAARSGLGENTFVHHGINHPTFSHFLESKGSNKKLTISCVMTNQWRKRWALLFEALSRLTIEFELKILIDTLIGYWNIYQLAGDNHIDVTATISGPSIDDFKLAEFYSTSDVLVLASYGEGFGYPVVEAQAAGTKVLTGAFGAQKELLHPDLVPVPHCGMETDGVNGLVKPWYNASDWGASLQETIEKIIPPGDLSEHAKKWDWSIQWPRFKNWFMEGLST
jgi:glycosyltransferase involved in cell wall biosynthesis